MIRDICLRKKVPDAVSNTMPTTCFLRLMAFEDLMSASSVHKGCIHSFVPFHACTSDLYFRQLYFRLNVGKNDKTYKNCSCCCFVQDS
jgi:hypothetical protein